MTCLTIKQQLKNLSVPPTLEGKKVKHIRIIPRQNAKFFKIQYVYKADEGQRKVYKQKALAIDFGTDILMICVTSEGSAFIIDGRRLKSINQWYNKRNTQLFSVKDKQKFGKKPTNQQQKKFSKAQFEDK